MIKLWHLQANGCIGEYHAKRDKPISKNRRTNDLTDKQMMTHMGVGRGQEWRKEGLYRGIRGVGEVGRRKK